MIRINDDTPTETLQAIKIGDMVTDGFSKTSLVENISISDDGLYRIYEFNLITGRTILAKRWLVKSFKSTILYSNTIVYELNYTSSSYL